MAFGHFPLDSHNFVALNTRNLLQSLIRICYNNTPFPPDFRRITLSLKVCSQTMGSTLSLLSIQHMLFSVPCYLGLRNVIIVYRTSHFFT